MLGEQIISSNWSLYAIEVLMDPNNNSMQMWMKITRATLTPCNEHSVSSKAHCTNTDPKHAYLAQAAEMNFRKPDFHAH